MPIRCDCGNCKANRCQKATYLLAIPGIFQSLVPLAVLLLLLLLLLLL